MKIHRESHVQWIISSLWLILSIKVLLLFQYWPRHTANSLLHMLGTVIEWFGKKTHWLTLDIQFLESAVFDSNPYSWSKNYHKVCFKIGPTLWQFHGAFLAIKKKKKKTNHKQTHTKLSALGVFKGGNSWNSPTALPGHLGTFLLNADVSYRGKITTFTEWQVPSYCR